MASKILVVTGANKGIGFACVKQLAKIYSDNAIVYLTARDETRGKEALEKLKQDGLKSVSFHQLDVCDTKSSEAFVNDMQKMHGKINVLVNNAGIAFKPGAREPVGVQAELMMATNFWGSQKFSNLAFPLLDKNSRVVNVAGYLGHLSCLNAGKEPEASALKAKLADPNISIETLNEMARDFVHRVQQNTHKDVGWISSAYSVSKIFVSVLTRIQQREMDKKRRSDNILINAVNPGKVNTDMTSHRGIFTPDRGCQSLVWAATIAEKEEKPRGGFVWHDNSEIDFTAPSYPSN